MARLGSTQGAQMKNKLVVCVASCHITTMHECRGILIRLHIVLVCLMCGDGCWERRKGKEAKLHVADMDVWSYRKGTGNMYLTDKRKHTGRSNKRENQGIAFQMVWVHKQKKIHLGTEY